MNQLVRVLLKSLLWFLIVLLLRPINYALDWSLSAYFKLKDGDSDFKPNWLLVGVLVFIVLSVTLIFYLYGQFIS